MKRTLAALIAAAFLSSGAAMAMTSKTSTGMHRFRPAMMAKCPRGQHYVKGYMRGGKRVKGYCRHK